MLWIWDSKRQVRYTLMWLALLICQMPATANQYPGQTPWQTMPPGQWNYAPPNQRQTGIPSKN
ncbi:MAG: hypothetical protein KZQ82_15060, partial [Candidatus Thiodiazotropha sp. (ex Lucinoma annulata)]|nr:hypothetical protein [Candidatus Thiodiazotropha sp. (ex Lucinoma annulata)]